MISCSASAALTPKLHTLPGGMDVRSRLDVRYGENTNVTRQNGRAASRAARRSGFWAVQPGFEISGQHAQGVYHLKYAGQYRHFQHSPADDYADHLYTFSGKWLPESHHALQWEFSRMSGHEARGQGVTEGLSDEQFQRYGIDQTLKTSLHDAELAYDYGLPEGTYGLRASVNRKTFSFPQTGHIESNFRTYVHDQAWKERAFAVALTQRFSSDHQIRYGLMSTKRHYHTNGIKNFDKYFLRVGFQTQYSAITRFQGNFSWLHQVFPDNAQAKSFEGPDWDLSAQWQPLRHSLWVLRGWQKVTDPTENGGYILDSGVGVSWQHHWWTDRFSTRFKWSYQSKSYHMSSHDRHDDLRSAEVVIGYDFRPSVRFELSYQQRKKTSNQLRDIFFIGSEREAVVRMPGYDQHQMQLTIKVQI